MRFTFINLLLLFLSILSLDGQKIELETKVSFIDDQRGTAYIILEFKYNAAIDSIGSISIDGNLLNYSSLSRGAVSTNGVLSRTTNFTFRFRPQRTGVYIVKEPDFYSEGRRAGSKVVKFEVSDILEFSEMNQEEKLAFQARGAKSTVNWRISFSEEKGYLEERVKGRWVYKRDLSAEEMKSIRKELQINED